MTTVMVVEDDSAILELIVVNLEHAKFEVIACMSAEEARQAVVKTLPDVVLLDWMLPGESGILFAKRLRSEERTRELPIIILSARAHEEDKVLGLEVGADDYVIKPFSPKELVARIQAVLRRRAPHLSNEVVTVAGLSINPVTRRISVAGEQIELGATEFRLLFFLATHTERVYTRAQLLDAVWGDHVFIEERTVDVHIRRLRLALEPFGAQDYVETVRGVGYRFRRE